MTKTAASAETDERADAPGAAAVWGRLAKARLSALVLVTTAAGFAVAPGDGLDWARLAWTCLGTGLAAVSAAMLNQLAEVRRDSLMRRTSGRPLPAGHARPVTVFVVGVLAGYAGCTVLALGANVLASAFAAANILLYVLVYTPLKPRPTLNTLVGAVTGAIPPVIGWVAACGSTGPGAVSLFALLFAWQLPHFLALAWMYRHDYEAGGFARLPSRDPSGIATAQSCVLTSLLLVPVGLLPTLTGVAGVAYASIATVAGIWMSAKAASFLRARTDLAARKLFLASLGYLPVVLGAMVLDRGSIVPTARPAPGTTVIEVPAQPADDE
jgi:protoheme IX farnesyltransferase